MSKVALLLFAPAQHSCLVEHSAVLHLFLVDPLPLRDTRRFSSIRPAAAHDSVLQDSRRMRKQTLILFPFCAPVKTYLRLMSCGFPGEPWGRSMYESLSSDSQYDMASGGGTQESLQHCSRAGWPEAASANRR